MGRRRLVVYLKHVGNVTESQKNVLEALDFTIIVTINYTVEQNGRRR